MFDDITILKTTNLLHNVHSFSVLLQMMYTYIAGWCWHKPNVNPDFENCPNICVFLPFQTFQETSQYVVWVRSSDDLPSVYLWIPSDHDLG